MKTSFLAARFSRVLAAVLGVVLGTALGIASAAPALAHTALKRSDPEKNAKVESLERVELEFTQPVRLPTVILRGPDGETYHTGKPKVDGALVIQDVADDLPPGSYTIAYRVVSPDGHPVEGEIPFTLVAPEPTESPAAEEEGGDGAATPEPTAPAGQSAEPSAGAAETPAGGAPGGSGDAADEAAGNAAPASSEERSGGVPAWVWMVVFGLAGIGIGLAISLRPKKAGGEQTTKAAEDR